MNKWNNKFRYQVASCWLFIGRRSFLAALEGRCAPLPSLPHWKRTCDL